MSEKMDDSLPLFVRLRDPITVYVVDNELIGMYDTGISYNFFSKAFELLKQLYNYPPAKTVIPKTMHEYLEGELRPIKKAWNIEYPRVIGLEEMGFCNCCFDFDLAINDDTDKPIILQKFVYEYQDKQIPYDYQLSFSIEKAFIILANICSDSGSGYLFDWIRKENKDLSFNVPLFKQAIEDSNKRNQKYINPKIAEEYLTRNNFALAYLIYQKEQLEKNIITPFELLRLNGPYVLTSLIACKPVKKFFDQILIDMIDNFQTLSQNQKIMYYTFFELTKEIAYDCSIDFYKELEDFIKLNLSTFVKLERELLIGMPLMAKY